ncbi:MAG: glycosyltransferase family A protein [Syntrophomonas sp.]
MTKNRRSYERKMQNGISVITCTNRPLFMPMVFANYNRQQHPWSELIIILNNNQMKIDEWEREANKYRNIRVCQLDEDVTLGTCYNFAIKQARYNYIAKFDDDDYYASLYLSEAAQTFNCVDTDIVGKATRFIYFEDLKTLGLYAPFPEFSYVRYIVGATMVVKKEVFDVISFPDITVGEDSNFQNSCNSRGFKIYSAGKYNYATIRHPSSHGHTFEMDDLTYLRYCRELCRTDDYMDLISNNQYDDIFK